MMGVQVLNLKKGSIIAGFIYNSICFQGRGPCPVEAVNHVEDQG